MESDDGQASGSAVCSLQTLAASLNCLLLSRPVANSSARPTSIRKGLLYCYSLYCGLRVKSGGADRRIDTLRNRLGEPDPGTCIWHSGHPGDSPVEPTRVRGFDAITVLKAGGLCGITPVRTASCRMHGCRFATVEPGKFEQVWAGPRLPSFTAPSGIEGRFRLARFRGLVRIAAVTGLVQQ